MQLCVVMVRAAIVLYCTLSHGHFDYYVRPQILGLNDASVTAETGGRVRSLGFGKQNRWCSEDVLMEELRSAGTWVDRRVNTGSRDRKVLGGIKAVDGDSCEDMKGQSCPGRRTVMMSCHVCGINILFLCFFTLLITDFIANLQYQPLTL